MDPDPVVSTSASDDLAPLPFGIPQLDELLGFDYLLDWPVPDAPPWLPCLNTRTSLTIAGEDGTGKSIFALHLVSTYAALVRTVTKPAGPLPHVLYVSSDYRFAAAQKVWREFCLDYPWERYVPFISQQDLKFRRGQLRPPKGEESRPKLRIQLSAFTPKCEDDDSGKARCIASYVGEACKAVVKPEAQENSSEVAFLDLAACTTGDDWLYVNRLVAAVPRTAGAPPNLLVLDSVAGFEALVGERNSFGEQMSRRARVAQLMRAAGEDWHIIFVAEEPETGAHHPEEYVTDTVLHLCRHGKGQQSRRALEIEKCRARSFGTGEHPFEIRNGRGSSTRCWENPDDPYTMLVPEDAGGRLLDRPTSAYIQVFPSLNFLSKKYGATHQLIRTETRSGAAGGVGPLGFGIPDLDRMLHIHTAVGEAEATGLPPGTVTSLSGDEGTLKSRLAEQFLEHSFDEFPEILKGTVEMVRLWAPGEQAPSEEFKDFVTSHGALIGSEAKFFSDRAVSLGTKQRIMDRLETCTKLDGSMAGVLRHLADPSKRWSIPDQDWVEKKLAGLQQPLMRRWDVKRYYEPDAASANSPHAVQRRQLLLAISILRMSWGILTPVVLISTHDISAESIANRIYTRLEKAIVVVLQGHLGSEEQAKTFLKAGGKFALLRLWERFIVVRRIELMDATGPQVWHIIYRCVLHALYMLGYSGGVDWAIENPVRFAETVRVVVGDLRLIRETYPQVRDDALFLPTLVFRLRRMGVTSLLVDSDTGRPGNLVTNPFSAALRSLVDHQIYTWPVPFFGEQRVAITAVPVDPGAPGVIRELRYMSRSRTPESEPDRLTVDSHFELYSGLETGEPEAVPLRILLYEETPAFHEYVAAETPLYSRLFTAEENSSVFQLLKTQEYSGLKDYCQLPTYTRLPNTLVFMIDDYWTSSMRGALRPQWEYLNAEPGEDPAAVESEQGEHTDVFRLFREPKRSPLPDPKEVRRKRLEFFVQKAKSPGSAHYYLHRLPQSDDKRSKVDRIPFMWDFAFLLCNRSRWDAAKAIELSELNRSPADGDPARRTVGDIWKGLTRWNNLPEHPEAIVGWREFLEASSEVAAFAERMEGKRAVPFDLSMGTPDSMICLLMEMWFSEILKDVKFLRGLPNDHELKAVADKWVEGAESLLRALSSATLGGERRFLQEFVGSFPKDSRPSFPDTERLCDVCKASGKQCDKTEDKDRKDEACRYRAVLLRFESPGYSLQLYRTWLLLVEALDLSRYLDEQRPFELRPDHSAAPEAVSARHWYKTACNQMPTAGETPDGKAQGDVWDPVRLPGQYSMRGDWHLAVARGSRSYKLADRALDLLSSRRANRTRLHLGLGLPTRDISDGGNIAGTRTRLTVLSEERGVESLKYGDLLQLGAKAAQHSNGEPFHWLFRTGLDQYDRQVAVLQKWIHRLFVWTIGYRQKNLTTWRKSTGFRCYDELEQGILATVGNYSSYRQEFPESLVSLVEDLDNACLPEKGRD